MPISKRRGIDVLNKQDFKRLDDKTLKQQQTLNQGKFH